MLKGGAASHYAARRLQLAAAGSSPKALLAAVVTTGTRLDSFFTSALSDEQTRTFCCQFEGTEKDASLISL
mgnify:CR=1 FL=1